MTRFKATGIGALAIALAAAPVSSALANGGGQHYHNGYYFNPFYPIVGLAAAVVGTAAAIVTLPLALIGAAARAPGYAQPGYAAPPAYYGNAPVPYYAAPSGSYYYAPPQAYAPVRPVYRSAYRAPGNYAPNAGYVPQNGGQYAPPTAYGAQDNGYAPPPANHPAPPSAYGQGNYRYNSNPNGYAPRPVSYGPPAGAGAPDYRPNN